MEMANKDYQMTTVYNYLKILDEDSAEKEKTVSLAAERYLLKARKNNANAQILEKLLA